MEVVHILSLLVALSHQSAPLIPAGNRAIIGETFALEDALFYNASSVFDGASELGIERTIKRQITCDISGYCRYIV